MLFKGYKEKINSTFESIFILPARVNSFVLIGGLTLSSRVSCDTIK